MVEKIVQAKAKGNQAIAHTVKTKLILKGIPVGKFTPMSPDDPTILQKLREAAREFGVIV